MAHCRPTLQSGRAAWLGANLQQHSKVWSAEQPRLPRCLEDTGLGVSGWQKAGVFLSSPLT